MFDNPYYREFSKIRNGEERYKLVREYAWAIPTEETARELVRIAPRIVEIGAGTGYWAYVLAQLGADVLCYDADPYSNAWCTGKWYPVQKGRSIKAARHPDRALFLCWPPHDESMAYLALTTYGGDTLIYIGEGYGGCTGNDRFHALLGDEVYDYSDGKRVLKYPVGNQWHLDRILDIPQWYSIRDSVFVYRR